MRVSGIARRLGMDNNPLRRRCAPTAHLATEPSPVDRRTLGRRGGHGAPDHGLLGGWFYDGRPTRPARLG